MIVVGVAVFRSLRAGRPIGRHCVDLPGIAGTVILDQGIFDAVIAQDVHDGELGHSARLAARLLLLLPVGHDVGHACHTSS